MAHGAAIWLPFVQPFATVFLGLGAAAIAYRQWRTAHDKLRLDLFHQRIANFNNVTRHLDEFRFMSFLNGDGKTELEQYINASKLYFGKDMWGLMIEAQANVLKIRHESHVEKYPDVASQASLDVDRIQEKMRIVLYRYTSMARIR